MSFELDAKKPEWLKIKLPGGGTYNRIKKRMRDNLLYTVCEEAHCPNIGECWSMGTATFMIMGDLCTRGCRFCNVKSGKPVSGWLDHDEPEKVAHSVEAMRLEYVVITSVDRDDLPDGGAEHFAETIRAVKRRVPTVRVETLIPDFSGEIDGLRRVLDARPDVLAHNIETVRRLTPRVRDPRATYDQSLELLRRAKELAPTIYTKSSIMLGLGETDDEIREAFADLRAVGVPLLTIGQYLRPSRKHLSVERYVSPASFEVYRQQALELGFQFVASGPMVRSSYRAAELFILSDRR
ncbi:MAG: lipoyl synthase [Myxococcales bacterium]|nr:lipoyl synthase [Myxococcales bacterium]